MGGETTLSAYEDLGERQFIGRRGGDVVPLVDGSVIAGVPEAKHSAERARDELRFDFLNDAAVLDLLRRRHLDEEEIFKAGFAHGVPLAIVGFGATVYWGGVARYWDTVPHRAVYLAIAAAIVGAQLFLFVRSAKRHWGDPVRQNVRARARRYREIAHVARRGGAEVPAHYPHYGPYPFAAKFRPEADNAGLSETEGSDEH